MKQIVANATPIIALSMIGKLDLLGELFDEIIVPQAVYDEIMAGKGHRAYGKAELKYAIDHCNIKIYQVKNQTMVQEMFGRLHKGELETIVSAKELKIPYVLIDEPDARKLANTLLLKPIGTVGFLSLAKQKGKMQVLKPCLDELIAKGFRLSKPLYKKVLNSVGESVYGQ
ncbi:putative nucleic acid-binding protein [Caldalkalibacillus uzonensis]|uniref:Nucleic acid-binding protein n=1 Tax=Caldalkalibacillus uzonensis TaxID=353224 RepID=A0ABU0CUI2_9BACI|nr:DUF3368 domain-containing protein [Caldalkalibacillus uzonensis]MDQ0340010.1 putative nucleic acid-binding protein [Caldalkalibacillus uzonensis]